MDEALDFILESTIQGRGSEIFVPKLRAYSIRDIRDALKELLGNADEKKISIRPGEKMHETLINEDEMRYAWEYRNKYVIFNPIKNEEEIKRFYPNIKKLTKFTTYSSNVVPKISKNELKTIIKKTGLI
jgi:FlaA1/EpsC-like NDP-sugar epimerase